MNDPLSLNWLESFKLIIAKSITSIVLFYFFFSFFLFLFSYDEVSPPHETNVRACALSPDTWSS